MVLLVKEDCVKCSIHLHKVIYETLQYKLIDLSRISRSDAFLFYKLSEWKASD